MSKGRGQILQDDTARNGRKAGFEQRAIVSNVATDVHENRLVGIPAQCFTLERILVQPAASDRLLHRHVLDQSSPVLGILGEPRVRVQVGLVRRLEDSGLPIRDVLVFAPA